MGGTVLVRASPILQEAKYKISGVTVLDIVEGVLYTLLLLINLAEDTDRLSSGGDAYDARSPRLAPRRI